MPKLTCKQRNLDSDQLYFITCCEHVSAERARFFAEQAHVNFSYETAADWLELARLQLRHITGFLIGRFLMRTMGRTVKPKFLDGFKNMKAAYRQQLTLFFSIITYFGSYTHKTVDSQVYFSISLSIASILSFHFNNEKE